VATDLEYLVRLSNICVKYNFFDFKRTVLCTSDMVIVLGDPFDGVYMD